MFEIRSSDIYMLATSLRWEGGLRRPLLGCYLTLPAYIYGWSVVSWTTIIGRFFLHEMMKVKHDEMSKSISTMLN